MSIETTIDRQPALGRARHERPSGILVDEPSSRFALGRERGSLYILIQVSGQEAGRDAIAAQLAGTVRQAYTDWQGSVTSGLQNAIRQANRLLYEDNRDSLPGDRRTAGITCVVLRGTSGKAHDDQGDLFIAQAGPAAAYLAREGKVERFPDRSPWLDNVPAEELDAWALGERADVNISLFHRPVVRGDTFLLVESEIAQNVPADWWENILAGDTVGAILQSLDRAGVGGELLALAVRLDGEATQPAVEQPVESVPAPEHEPSVPFWVPVLNWLEEIQASDRLRQAGRVIVAALASIWATLVTLFSRLVPGQLSVGQETKAQAPTTKESTSKAKKRRTKAVRTQSTLVRRILLGVAIAIPVAVAAIVLVTYWQRGRVQTAELEALYQEANSRWQTAVQTADQATVRTLLTEANAYLDELRALQPDHPQAIELQRKISVLLDELSQVRRISWIAELNEYPSGAAPDRVVVEGVDVFVLDRNAGKVYHHQLDELQQSLLPDTLDTVLVSEGAQVGSVLVSDLIDITWMPTDFRYRKESLVILESNGSLLQYDPATAELLALPVTGSEMWQNPLLIGGHTGRLYILDPAANKIWRYDPTAGGYTDAADEWLQTAVDLAGTNDMAIGDSIYLLYTDGRMRKLSAGQPDAFDISDWDVPPQSPTALFTRPLEDTQFVYVADRGNSRIVQSGKEGQFERQFRLADAQLNGEPDPLGSINSLFVDEIGGRAYFLSDRKLYLAILPD
ncbi:MAG: hypothetical protein PVJ23_00405 [Anaerolineae bacterium]|jgi:hypothetical protein